MNLNEQARLNVRGVWRALGGPVAIDVLSHHQPPQLLQVSDYQRDAQTERGADDDRDGHVSRQYRRSLRAEVREGLHDRAGSGFGAAGNGVPQAAAQRPSDPGGWAQ